jgi:hypothetical protein
VFTLPAATVTLALATLPISAQFSLDDVRNSSMFVGHEAPLIDTVLAAVPWLIMTMVSVRFAVWKKAVAKSDVLSPPNAQSMRTAPGRTHL